MGEKNSSAAITVEVEFLHGSRFGSFGNGGAVKVGAFLYTLRAPLEFLHSFLIPKPFVGQEIATGYTADRDDHLLPGR